MSVVLRPAGLDDAREWAAVVAGASPYLVQDARSVEHEMQTDPPGAVRSVACLDDMVVGISRLRAYDDEDHASLQVMVLPVARRQGVGRALIEAMAEPLADCGKVTVHSIVEDDDDSRAAAAALGYELTRTLRMSAVDPRDVPAPDPDSRVVTLDACDPRSIHALFNAVVGDDPSGLSLTASWEEWLDDWEDPRNRADLSCGVVIDGELVAFSQLGSAGARAWSNMTGTHPGHRGRGLAGLAKRHSLAHAATAGITRCFAGNDGENGPMVAINASLGYVPFAAPRLGVRVLS